MLTADQIDAELADLCAELVNAEECHRHRGVAEIRAEIAVYRTMRDQIPAQRSAQVGDKPVDKHPNGR